MKAPVLPIALMCVLFACSTTIDGSDTDNTSGAADSGLSAQQDAEVSEDPQIVLLSHSTGSPVANANVNCRYGEQGPHADTSHFRVFPAVDIGGSRIIEAILPIEVATAPGGTQSATLKLHELTGDILAGEFTLLFETDFDVADQTLGELSIPLDVTVEEDVSIVIEVSMTDGEQLRNLRFGHNLEAQTAPTYYASATCGQLQPTDLATLDNPFVPGATFAANSWLVSLRAEVTP